MTHQPAEGAADLFWQASIKAYDEGVCAASHDPAALAAGTDLAALEATAAALADPRALPEEGVTLDWSDTAATHSFNASQASVGAELTALCVRAEGTFDSARTLIELRFDGVVTTLVPLRDFFGGLAEDASAATFYTSHDATNGEWCARFRMPFRDEARLRLVAPSAEAERLLHVRFTQRAMAFDDARYFHAQWQRTPEVVENLSDHRAVTIEGSEGHFIGLVMALTNRSHCWWGEGDEKVFVDDEPSARLFGTGTEDYFGYAWASSEVFLAPFHGQPEAGVGRGIDVCGRGEDLGGTWWNYRWHHLDPIDFRSSLRFDMEVWHWGGDAQGIAPLDLAFTGFWYGSTPQVAPSPGELAARPGVWPEP